MDHEAEDVAEDEDLGQPADRDDAGALGLDGADDAAERHVEGGREEDGGEEDEEGLDDVGDEFAGQVVGYCSAAVAGYLDCLSLGQQVS